MHEVAIRFATLDDALYIADLGAQLGYPGDEMDYAGRMAELLQQSNHAIYVAGYEEGDVIAWLHIYIYYTLLSDPVVMVGGLVVDAAHRGQGLGRRMMAKAETWGCARGCEAVYVKANITRAGARAFYERLGFEAIKEQRVLRKAI